MDETCPVCATADIVCGKWTLLLVRDLSEGRSRFCELERSLAGISPRTLSLRLRALEEEGIVERHTYPEVPPRVEYALTPKGEALLPIIDSMREYGSQWLAARVCGRERSGRHRRRLTETRTRNPCCERGWRAELPCGRCPRSPSPVVARSRPAPSPEPGSCCAPACPRPGARATRLLAERRRRRLRAHTLQAPRRFQIIGADTHGVQVRTRRRGGPLDPVGRAARRRRPWPRPPEARRRLGPDLGRRRRRAAAACAGRRGLRAAVRRRPEARRGAATSAPAPPRSPARARDHHRATSGAPRLHGPRRAQLRRGADRVRAPHRQRERLRARGLRRHRAGHRQVPPRHQRLERHRLQLPRRQVRPDLRGPRGRHRPAGDRRPGRGLEPPVDRHREHRHVHDRRADAAGASTRSRACSAGR